MFRHSHRLALAGALLFAAAPVRAAIEDAYVPGEPPITTTWWERHDPVAQAADRKFVAGMRPHHVGALSMSTEYLADPERRSPLLRSLALAIISNQRFEIAMMDAVAFNLDAPPLRLPLGITLQPVATEGLTGLYRYFRGPVPSPLDAPVGPVSRRDVLFAKAMTLHHAAALQMAGDYLHDPAATNGYLGLMNVDIRTDQSQEIALMRLAINAYPDADSVSVDPSMVHGMEGITGQHHVHRPAAQSTATEPAVAEAHGGHMAVPPTPSAGPAARRAKPRPSSSPERVAPGAEPHRH